MQLFIGIGLGHDLRRFGGRQIGDRFQTRRLHLLVDGARAHVQRTAEDEGKAENVVDLVRIVRPAGRHHGVGTRGHRVLGRDLRNRVGKRHDQGAFGHGLQHPGLEHAGHRDAEEDIGAMERVGE